MKETDRAAHRPAEVQTKVLRHVATEAQNWPRRERSFLQNERLRHARSVFVFGRSASICRCMNSHSQLAAPYLSYVQTPAPRPDFAVDALGLDQTWEPADMRAAPR
ncbi:hypothetical protein SKAU_G00395610 [Synaphobranchus kaupii]|uniref:Uncharacterized protein n=1 Tax=Synaphobranchus kaupii TaxID=118154 RepID=A0A9Q1ECE8_SYNKA|nr:hypothetical protein SKAU_G00395610 [Synaphobranchus kaupii]